MSNSKLIVAAAAALLASPLLAQQAMDHSKMGHSKMQGMDHSKMMKNTPANPYAQSEMKMHGKMMKAVGADPALDAKDDRASPRRRRNVEDRGCAG